MVRIETERLILRDLEDKDKKDLVILANDLEVTRLLAVVPHPYTSDDAEWFVNHCSEESSKNPRGNYELAIELKDSGELVGVIGLTKVNQLDKKATLGYWLGKNYWRKGIMYEAVYRLMQFAFKDLDLQRIEATASKRNDASKGLIKKIGFTQEGTSKRYHCTKSTGEFLDTNIYGLLKEDFK
jgi:[ribosomal protein S5]-alanine N-acetyltransferase